jgi:hypothetical protein
MKKAALPVFVVEEHHEAYIIWKFALLNGLIPKQGNTLIHIDEHSDMGAPILETPLHQLNGDLEKIKTFTYDELTIATFIVPAIYDRLFRKIYWIRQRHNKASRRGNPLYVRAPDSGRKLVTGQMSVFETFKEDYEKLKDEIVGYKFYKQHIDQLGHIDYPLLDIDLDYFSCIQDPLKKALDIQITKKEYDDFRGQKYHRVRYFDFGKVQAIQDGDNYLLRMNHYSEPYMSPLKVIQNTIADRIDRTIEGLNTAKITPRLITICRSRFSGYTPEDQWEYIEQTLLSKLKQVYDINSVQHISEL